MQHTTIAVDLAKSVFQVAISHRPGRVDKEHRLSRRRFLTRIMREGAVEGKTQEPPCGTNVVQTTF